VHVGKVRRTHTFSCCLSSFGGIDPSNIATFGCLYRLPMPESSKVKHKATDCGRLDECRGMRSVDEGMGLISTDLKGKTQQAITFGLFES